MSAMYIALAALLIPVGAQAMVESSEVRYGPQDKYRGHLVRPLGDGPFPALVVIHEWWGLNDHIRAQAASLAESGYAALAVDLFGKSTTDPQEAARLSGDLDPKEATAALLAAADYLRSRPFVSRNRVGGIGWCFGGRQALNLAINDHRLAAAVIYYGRPVTDPAEISKIKAAILGVFGEADQSIPMDQVRQFQKALADAKVTAEIHTYPGAGHAFANPSRGESFNPDAAIDAWTKTMSFLEKHLKDPAASVPPPPPFDWRPAR